MKEIAGINSNMFKILIVDKMLKPFEFQLVKASNGREALHAIQERLGTPEEIDLAIVDLMMPDIDGYKVIEVLRNGANDGEFNIPAHSKEKLPIVILSGMNFSEDIKRGLELGANQFVTKPVVMAQLYSTITEELTKKIQAGKYQ